MPAWTAADELEYAPLLPGQKRSELLARLRELARLAAAIDGNAAGTALRERVRLVRGWSEAGFDRTRGSGPVGLTAELLLSDLARHGVFLLRRPELEGAARAPALAAFQRLLHPLLTPLTLDKAHPLPRARLRGVLVVATLAPGDSGDPGGAERPRFTLVPVPPWGGRWLRLDGGPPSYAPAEELVRLGLTALFPNELVASHVLRIVRPEDETVPGAGPWLEHEPGLPAPMLERLRAELRIEPEHVHVSTGLLGLADLAALCEVLDRA